MNTREKHRRIRAYARAAKRALDSFTRSSWDRSRELHAWNRLPAHVRAAIACPQPEDRSEGPQGRGQAARPQMNTPIGEAVRVNVGFKYGRIGYIVGRYPDGNLIVEVDGRRYEYAPNEVISSLSNNGD